MAFSGPDFFEDALRAVFREELEGPVSDLASTLERIADSLAGLEGLTLPESAPPPPPEPLAPPPPACAVIGCKLPRGTLGYCVIHAQRRRQMIADNRLHAEWVEDAAPHSVPDVIPPRRPRGERKPREEAPAQVEMEVVRPVAEPRMFVRKKGVAPSVLPTKRGEKPDAGSESQASLPLSTSEQDQIVSTIGRWANEFKARKKPH
ncbi:cell wall protein [Pyxidicoccus xibeiensis]|uniref:cell wall protein n=1 Tax=Pyxidicoccus xibeiensis TaxID=2906759 RepID=UPI0020A7C281|nr:cell wall protein [Pyxidicoccus xibeiensis]MCP3136606.1 cell wall protein [Pyxidicoccus xibeiensis]